MQNAKVMSQPEISKNGGQQLVGVALDQDPDESVKDIQKDASKLENEINLDKKNIATLKERLDVQ